MVDYTLSLIVFHHYEINWATNRIKSMLPMGYPMVVSGYPLKETFSFIFTSLVHYPALLIPQNIYHMSQIYVFHVLEWNTKSEIHSILLPSWHLFHVDQNFYREKWLGQFCRPLSSLYVTKSTLHKRIALINCLKIERSHYFHDLNTFSCRKIPRPTYLVIFAIQTLGDKTVGKIQLFDVFFIKSCSSATSGTYSPLTPLINVEWF